MNIYFPTLALLFGLALGSFLNVCIYRLPRKLSVNKPIRSFCPACEAQLGWYENIPLFSWLLQRAKCKHCSEKISFRYPLVELLSGLAALASYFCFGENLTALVIYLVIATLIVITFIDLDFKIIPNRITYPGMLIGFAIGAVSEYFHLFNWPITDGLLDSLIGFLLGGGFFYAVGGVYYLISRRIGLGGGDIKLMSMLGAILGWQAMFPTIFFGSMLGSVVGVLVLFTKKSGRHTEIPFGPWLALGAILYIFWDPKLFVL